MSQQEDLVIRSVLTHGGQSTVYEGKLGREPVAIKVYEEEQVCLDEYDMITSLAGVPGLLPLKVPSILRIKERQGSKDVEGMALVFDLLDDDLYQFALCKKRPLAMSNIKELASQILGTLSAMNRLGITHNDIKPENIMVVNNAHRIGPGKELVLANPQFRLIDLAYASRECVIAGTCTYYAPEQLANQGGVIRQFGSIPRAAFSVSNKVDVWAMGCVLVEMASGLRLFDFANDTRRFAGIYLILASIGAIDINEQVTARINEYAAQKMQTPKDTKLVKSAVNTLQGLKTREPLFFQLIQQMLQFDPKNRPTAEQCMQCPFLSQ